MSQLAPCSLQWHSDFVPRSGTHCSVNRALRHLIMTCWSISPRRMEGYSRILYMLLYYGRCSPATQTLRPSLHPPFTRAARTRCPAPRTHTCPAAHGHFRTRCLVGNFHPRMIHSAGTFPGQYVSGIVPPRRLRNAPFISSSRPTMQLGLRDLRLTYRLHKDVRMF